jgi:hypothetical protein
VMRSLAKLMDKAVSEQAARLSLTLLGSVGRVKLKRFQRTSFVVVMMEGLPRNLRKSGPS